MKVCVDVTTRGAEYVRPQLLSELLPSVLLLLLLLSVSQWVRERLRSSWGGSQPPLES